MKYIILTFIAFSLICQAAVTNEAVMTGSSSQTVHGQKEFDGTLKATNLADFTGATVIGLGGISVTHSITADIATNSLSLGGVLASGYQPLISTSGTGSYYRGDKTWATLPNFITATGTAATITGTINGTQVSGTVGNAAWASSTDIAAATDYASYFDADQNALSAVKTYSDFNAFFGPVLSSSMDIGYLDGPIGTIYPTSILSGSDITITRTHIGLSDNGIRGMTLLPSGQLDTTGTISAVKFVGNLSGTASYATTSGMSTVPTPGLNDNTLTIASTQYVQNAIADAFESTQIVTKSITETRVGGTSLPDAELAVWTKPNTVYTIAGEFYFLFSPHLGDGGYRFNFSGNSANYYFGDLLEITADTSGNVLAGGNSDFYQIPNFYLPSNHGYAPFSTTSTYQSTYKINGIIKTTHIAGALQFNWSQYTSGTTTTQLMAGSWITLTEMRNPQNTMSAWMNATSGTTSVVVNDGRNNSAPSFAYSPDGATKICVYWSDPYFHGSNNTVGQVRYLPAGGASWSSAQYVFGKTGPVSGSRIPNGITYISGSTYLLTGMRQCVWPSSNPAPLTICTLQKAFWDGSKLVFGAVSDMPTGYAYSAGANPICKVTNGDLLYPMYVSTDGTSGWNAGFQRSTDGGSTWSVFTSVKNPATEMEILAKSGTTYFITREGPTLYSSTNSGTTIMLTGTISGLTSYQDCKPTAVIANSGAWGYLYRAGSSAYNTSTYYATSSNGLTYSGTTMLNSGFSVYGDFQPTPTGVEGVYSSGNTSSFDPSAISPFFINFTHKTQ